MDLGVAAADSAALLDITDMLRPFFTPDLYGQYVVQLIVNDGCADSAPDTMTMTVAAAAESRAERRRRRRRHAATRGRINVLGNDTDPEATR